MFKKQRSVAGGLLILLLVVAGSCKSKYEKLKASNDNTKKFAEGKRLYEKKQYSKALGLFETLLTRYRNQEGAEELFYLNAMTTYKLKDYTAASYYFKEYAKDFPSSIHAEEARFLTAYCLYLEAPIFSLDQANTLKSIEAMQLYINLYPKGEHVAEANKLVDELHGRLEEKAFANAKLYYVTGNYQAAVISFGNTLRDYPDTKYAEEIEYLNAKAQYQYARNSRETRQEERFEEAKNLAIGFVEKYPTSKYLKEVNGVKEDSENGIVNVRRIIAAAASDERLARKLARKDSVLNQTPSVKMDIHKKIPN
jgi:outer membrane protein assembly factor BamD